MARQQPSLQVAETSGFAGPFLRFQGGAGAPGEEDRWTGSILCLSRGSGTPVAAAPASPPGNGGPRVVATPLEGPAKLGLDGHEAPILVLADHESQGGEQRLSPTRLDACLGWYFWRFDLALHLTEWQRPLQYRVIAGGDVTAAHTFWLPAAGQPMHWGYFSCNGMSEDVAPEAPERQDPTYLWRDLLQLHAAFPLHCLVGGGDQLYNDGVWHCPSLSTWGASTEHDTKVEAPWTPEMEDEATRFYLTNYIDSFSTPDSALALASIPQTYIWDDHDIWDGYGSYEPATQGCPVFQGLFSVARRFYLLFQHHTTDALNRQQREFLTNDGSEFHFLKYLGPQVALLGIDMRSQRTQHSIMPQATYDMLRSTVAAMPHGPLHLIVLSGIPLIFPKIPGTETLLGCLGKVTRSIPVIKNAARATGILDKFGQVEIMDDLVDGWVADEHTEERLQFIRLLQEFATTKSLRVSILSGDAHVGGVGRLYSRPKFRNLGDDPLYMCQIISSAIVNAPPPHPVTKMLMRTNFASNVDGRTREKLVRAFYPYHPRTDKLIAQRNWCDVSLVAPPFAAPTVPQDKDFGGLRFVLRVENPRHRRGYADETYEVMVPRHPGSGSARAVLAPSSRLLRAPSSRAALVGLPASAEGELTAQRRQQHHDVRVGLEAAGGGSEEEEGAAAGSRWASKPWAPAGEAYGPATPRPAMA